MAASVSGKMRLISDLEAVPNTSGSYAKIARIIELARAGQFSDLASDFDCPLMTLETMLKDLNLDTMAAKCRTGHYDHDE